MSNVCGPLAFFDSGYGGLTIMESVRKLLPQYDYVYLGDNARNPYGTRSFDVVYQYTLECVNKLFSFNSPLAIIACNTASAKALRTIQQNDLPTIDASRRVLGVIRPSVEAIGEYTKTGHVGVFATQGTVDSLSYPMELQKLHPDITVHQQACPMWVPLVENSEYMDSGADYFVKKYCDALMSQSDQIDVIILACTHYPLLLPKIQNCLPKNVRVICQGDIVAKSLENYLFRHPEMECRLTRGGSVRFLTTENPHKFKFTAKVFFQGDLDVQQII